MLAGRKWLIARRLRSKRQARGSTFARQAAADNTAMRNSRFIRCQARDTKICTAFDGRARRAGEAGCWQGREMAVRQRASAAIHRQDFWRSDSEGIYSAD